jgi:hypothetical protein
MARQKGTEHMKPPAQFVQIIERTRYDVTKTTLIASDAYWDGHNFERHGRNTFLYKTPKGRYFTVTLTQWQGERDHLEPVSLDEAISLYEGRLSEHEVEYAAAFPDVEVQEA